MRNCPFCGKEVKLVSPQLMYLPDLKKWSYMHHCNDKTSVMITADIVGHIVTEWNGRAKDA